MKDEILKQRILEQLQESWDDARVYDYVDNKRKMNGTGILQTEYAAKFDLLLTNKGLFAEEEYTAAHAYIKQQRDEKLAATIKKGSSK